MKSVVGLVVAFLMGAVSGGYLLRVYYMIGIYEASFAVKTKKPLLILGESGDNLSILPAETILYHERTYAEGHSTYKVYFNFDGEIEGEKVDPNSISPIGLHAASKDDIHDFCKAEH